MKEKKSSDMRIKEKEEENGRRQIKDYIFFFSRLFSLCHVKRSGWGTTTSDNNGKKKSLALAKKLYIESKQSKREEGEGSCVAFWSRRGLGEDSTVSDLFPYGITRCK